MVTYPPDNLAATLAALLKQRGLTSGALARDAGLSAPAVYQILKGKTETPHQRTLEKLATALNVPLERLFLGGAYDRASFMRPDPEILSQIPETIGPELEAMIQRELADATPLGPGSAAPEAYQDILKMKLYLILTKEKLGARGNGRPGRDASPAKRA